jgi:hypothetical protein
MTPRLSLSSKNIVGKEQGDEDSSLDFKSHWNGGAEDRGDRLRQLLL